MHDGEVDHVEPEPVDAAEDAHQQYGNGDAGDDGHEEARHREGPGPFVDVEVLLGRQRARWPSAAPAAHEGEPDLVHDLQDEREDHEVVLDVKAELELQAQLAAGGHGDNGQRRECPRQAILQVIDPY